MKSNSTQNALSAFKKLGAVALITATIFFVACNQAVGGNSGTGGGGGKPKHDITFSVDSTTPNGTLKAKADGEATETEASPITVEHGKAVTFTATADDGYRVKGWTLDGNAVNGTAETYTLTVTQPATVKVSFEAIPKHAITFSVEGANGTLKAKADGVPETSTSPINVEEGKEVTFTATADDGYRVKGWTLDGKPITEAGTNTEYKLKVSKPATVKVSFELSPVEGGAVLILSPNKLDIRVVAKTADNSAITVEGCNEATLESDKKTKLTAKGTRVVLKGNITELSCSENQLVALNVQGLTALKELDCQDNKLTELNVQGCAALQKLYCSGNQLTELNVQGLTALQGLWCPGNQLTELNASGCTSLQKLNCYYNQLTELNVQGLNALKQFGCFGNKLNAQAMTQILNALPARGAGDNAMAILYTERTDKQEGNCKDYTQPEDLKKAFEGAKSRKWKLRKENASGGFEYI